MEDDMRRRVLALAAAYAGAILTWWSAGQLNAQVWPRRQFVPLVDLWVWAWRPLWIAAALAAVVGLVVVARRRRRQPAGPDKSDPAHHIAALRQGAPAHPTQQDDRTPLVLEGLAESYKVDPDGTVSWHHKLEPPVIVDDLAKGAGRARYIARLDYPVAGDRFDIGKWRGRENWLSVVIRAELPDLAPRRPDLGSSDWSQPVLLGRDQRGHDLHAETADMAGWLAGGIPKYGKTIAMRIIVHHFARDPDAILWGFDGKNSAPDWSPIRGRFARWVDHDNNPKVTAERLLGMLRDALTEVCHRQKSLDRATLPGLLVMVEEAALFRKLLERADKTLAAEFDDLQLAIAMQGRAVNVLLVATAQRPSAGAMDTDLRELYPTRLCMRMSTMEGAKMVLGDYPPDKTVLGFRPGEGWLRNDDGLHRIMVDFFDNDLWSAACAGLPAIQPEPVKVRRYS